MLSIVRFHKDFKVFYAILSGPSTSSCRRPEHVNLTIRNFLRPSTVNLKETKAHKLAKKNSIQKLGCWKETTLCCELSNSVRFWCLQCWPLPFSTELIFCFCL